MKLTLVIGGLAAGGTERQVALLANGLAGRGHQVQVVLLSQATPADYTLDPQVQVDALGVAGWWRLDKLIPALAQLRHHLATADLVYSFLDVANALSAIALAGKSVPLVWGWRASNLAPGRTAQLSHRLCRRLISKPIAAMVNTESVGQFYSASMSLSAAQLPVHLVPNGVAIATRPTAAVAAHWRRENKIPEDAFVVVCLSRAAAEKRQDLLLAAIAEQTNTYVILAGQGVPEALPNWLPEGLALERVRALDHVGDVSRLLAVADLLVQVSDQEGQPNTLLEAMWSRVPVVASQVGGVAALLTGGEGVEGDRGWLVPAGDVGALAAAIDVVQAGGEVVSQRVQCAEDYVQRHHSPTEVVVQTEQILEQVCRDHRQPE